MLFHRHCNGAGTSAAARGGRPRPAPPKPPALPPSLAPPETGSLDDAGPLYLSLSSLFSQIGARLRQTEAPYDAATIKDVLALLGRAELNPVEWEQFSEQRSDRYTRNVVAVDERFVALCLTWDAGQASKIHDHAGSSCFVKLLSGDLEEQKYAPRWLDGTWRELGGPEAVATGQATYMDDSRGLHRISNPSAEVPAVSLHIYAPGFEECGIYDDGDVTTGSMVSAMGVPSDDATLDQGKLSLAALGDELAGGATDVPTRAARTPRINAGRTARVLLRRLLLGVRLCETSGPHLGELLRRRVLLARGPGLGPARARRGPAVVDERCCMAGWNTRFQMPGRKVMPRTSSSSQGGCSAKKTG